MLLKRSILLWYLTVVVVYWNNGKTDAKYGTQQQNLPHQFSSNSNWKSTSRHKNRLPTTLNTTLSVTSSVDQKPAINPSASSYLSFKLNNLTATNLMQPSWTDVFPTPAVMNSSTNLGGTTATKARVTNDSKLSTRKIVATKPHFVKIEFGIAIPKVATSSHAKPDKVTTAFGTSKPETTSPELRFGDLATVTSLRKETKIKQVTLLPTITKLDTPSEGPKRRTIVLVSNGINPTTTGSKLSSDQSDQMTTGFSLIHHLTNRTPVTTLFSNDTILEFSTTGSDSAHPDAGTSTIDGLLPRMSISKPSPTISDKFDITFNKFHGRASKRAMPLFIPSESVTYTAKGVTLKGTSSISDSDTTMPTSIKPEVLTSGSSVNINKLTTFKSENTKPMVIAVDSRTSNAKATSSQPNSVTSFAETLKIKQEPEVTTMGIPAITNSVVASLKGITSPVVIVTSGVTKVKQGTSAAFIDLQAATKSIPHAISTKTKTAEIKAETLRTSLPTLLTPTKVMSSPAVRARFSAIKTRDLRSTLSEAKVATTISTDVKPITETSWHRLTTFQPTTKPNTKISDFVVSKSTKTSTQFAAANFITTASETNTATKTAMTITERTTTKAEITSSKTSTPATISSLFTSTEPKAGNKMSGSKPKTANTKSIDNMKSTSSPVDIAAAGASVTISVTKPNALISESVSPNSKPSVLVSKSGMVFPDLKLNESQSIKSELTTVKPSAVKHVITTSKSIVSKINPLMSSSTAEHVVLTSKSILSKGIPSKLSSSTTKPTVITSKNTLSKAETSRASPIKHILITSESISKAGTSKFSITKSIAKSSENVLSRIKMTQFTVTKPVTKRLKRIPYKVSTSRWITANPAVMTSESSIFRTETSKPSSVKFTNLTPENALSKLKTSKSIAITSTVTSSETALSKGETLKSIIATSKAVNATPTVVQHAALTTEPIRVVKQKVSTSYPNTPIAYVVILKSSSAKQKVSVSKSTIMNPIEKTSKVEETTEKTSKSIIPTVATSTRNFAKTTKYESKTAQTIMKTLESVSARHKIETSGFTATYPHKKTLVVQSKVLTTKSGGTISSIISTIATSMPNAYASKIASTKPQYTKFLTNFINTSKPSKISFESSTKSELKESVSNTSSLDLSTLRTGITDKTAAFQSVAASQKVETLDSSTLTTEETSSEFNTIFPLVEIDDSLDNLTTGIRASSYWPGPTNATASRPVNITETLIASSHQPQRKAGTVAAGSVETSSRNRTLVALSITTLVIVILLAVAIAVFELKYRRGKRRMTPWTVRSNDTDTGALVTY